MKRIVFAALIAMAAGALFAQGTAVQMGDSELDAAFGNMNAIRVENLNGFYGQVAARYRYQEAQLKRFAERNRLSPSELYLAAFMARTRDMSMERVMQAYRAEGSWPGAAQALGITLRSREMERLRAQARDDVLLLQTRDQDRLKDQDQLRDQDRDQLGSMSGGGGTKGDGGSGATGGGDGSRK